MVSVEYVPVTLAHALGPPVFWFAPSVLTLTPHGAVPRALTALSVFGLSLLVLPAILLEDLCLMVYQTESFLTLCLSLVAELLFGIHVFSLGSKRERSCKKADWALFLSWVEPSIN